MGAKFEVVSKFANSGIEIPVRKTKNSAGYDLAVAQDTIVPSYKEQERKIFNFSKKRGFFFFIYIIRKKINLFS